MEVLSSTSNQHAAKLVGGSNGGFSVGGYPPLLDPLAAAGHPAFRPPPMLPPGIGGFPPMTPGGGCRAGGVCKDPYCRDPSCPTAAYNAYIAYMSAISGGAATSSSSLAAAMAANAAATAVSSASGVYNTFLALYSN